MARFFAPALVLAPLLSSCGADWAVGDGDGDGITVAQGDCWDLVDGPEGSGLSGRDIFPGATETWYDGIDQNCGGDDDFDLDGDGWVPTGYAGQATLGVPGTGALPEGDCWDDPSTTPVEQTVVAGTLDGDVTGTPYPQPKAADVNPGISPDADTWYDGADVDCAGNDDFDQDGDGYDTMHHVQPDGTVGDDCIDGSWRDWDNLADVPAGDVNPSAAEVWYDGTDEDCDELTVDCDADGDGYWLDGLDAGVCLDDSQDCNDADPLVFPTDDAEVFYNGKDDNCNLVDEDGDMDGDGYWAEDYESILSAAGITVDDTVTLPDASDPRDCWDDTTLTEGEIIALGMSPVSGFTDLAAGEVYPGALDRPYDAVDQDCAGEDANADGAEDDYDWDGDAYESEFHRNRLGRTGSDCLDCPDGCYDTVDDGELFEAWCDAYCMDDDDNPAHLSSATINPGNVDDEPYDGTDADCDDWSDYDTDRDGQDAEHFGGTDCVDDGMYDDANPGGVDPADIHLGATETWYDGTDQDCNNLSDNDADEDGYDSEGQGGTDCVDGGGYDDSNPAGLAAAAVNPGATETWYDGTDQDCNDASDNDADEDGYDSEHMGGTDCIDGSTQDDANPAGLVASAVHPGATDTWYDGTDADCDDNDGDADGDGYYIDSYAFADHGGGYDSGDCDDTDSDEHPGADETCDGDDDDCDGDVDEDDAVDASDWYRDLDRDGYGDADVTKHQCYTPSNYVSDDTDCDDGDSTVYPAASEVCDGQYNDCDDSGYTSAGAPSNETDNDGDGYVECTLDGGGWDGSGSKLGDDCDDAEATVYPGASEVCDGQYNDCDDSSYSASSAPTDETDDDGDGYVDCTIDSGGWDGGGINGGDDCDDGESTVYPGAPEVCDGQWNNCSNGSYSASGAPTDETDDDGDGYVECTIDGGGWDGSGSKLGDDCDDDASGTNPGATEICDASNTDEDCDGLADDDDSYASGKTTYYPDDDSDTYGDETDGGTNYCDPPSGYVTDNTDCDDGASGTNPGATEVCDASDTDEDCDGLADDADSAASGKTTYYPDSDSDTYGDKSDSGTNYCDPPTGYVTDHTDCDDGASGTNPGATEICDASDTDEDCDGLADDADSAASGKTTYYPDSDSDTYGDETDSGTNYCDPPSGYVTDNTDCDDGAIGTHPGATETWYDGTDQDCGSDDDYDADADGYDSDAYSYGTADDCDDSDSGINPGVSADTTDGADNDCDDFIDEDAASEGELIITELMISPDGSGTEWFEIYNNSGRTLYLDGWEFTLTGGEDFCVSADVGLSVADGAALALCESSASFCDYVYGSNGYADFGSCAAADASFALSDTGDTLTVYGGAQDVTMDDVLWDSTWPFSTGSAAQVDDDYYDATSNDSDTNWCETDSSYTDGTTQYGTPGAANDPCAPPTVSSISPSEGLDAGGLDVTISGTWLSAVSSVTFDGVEAASITVVSDTELTVTTPAGSAGLVDVVVSDGTYSDTVSSGFLYTGTAHGIGWCDLQWPETITQTAGVAGTESIYGQIYVSGTTPPSGQGSGITAQVGYGDDGTDPSADPSWTWVDSTYSGDSGSNDEYATTITVDTAGTYALAYRFSDDGGTNYAYCDFDPGVDYSSSETYDTASQGTLTVN